MPAANNELRSILNAAEQAVARDDAASAEQLLRDALALQESTPDAPRDEIAKTLNNLAVVCEMTGNLKDAETCYRRAHTIATATLPPSDPFVTTSRENLEEFCKAQGLPLVPAPAAARPHESSVASAVVPPAKPVPASAKPVPPPPRPIPAPVKPVPAATQSVPSPAKPVPAATKPVLAPTRSVPAPPRSMPVPSKGGPARGIVIGVLILSALAVAIVLSRWLTGPSVAERAETIAQSEPVTTAPPSQAASAPAPTPAPAPAPAPPRAAREPEPVAAAPAPAAAASAPSRTTTTAQVTVVSAQLCRSLTTTGAWQCESARGAQAPGTLYFYTRVASDGDAVVEHRWYRDNQLHQRVELRIRANQSGFRTYSRTTISPERAGAWKVELRAADGGVLHEESFVVQ